MSNRAQWQFIIVGTCFGIVLQVLGRFDLGRVGLTDLASLDLRLVGLAFAALVLFPWWLSFRVPSDMLRLAVGLVGSLLPFVLFLGVSSSWSSEYGLTSALFVDLVYLVLLSGILMMPFTLNPGRAALVVQFALVWISLCYTLVGLASLAVSDRISAFGGGPNVFGRVVGMGAVSLVALLIGQRAPSATAVILPPMLAAVVLSGSRGAMLATATGLLAVALPSIRHAVRPSVLFVWIAVGATMWVFIGTRILSVVQERVLILTLEQGYASGREDLVPVAIQMARESPLVGYGLGSFGQAVGIPGEYPHNLFLQVLAEAGVVGMVLLCASLVYPTILMLQRYRASVAVRVMFALMVLVLVASMFSGDYFDARLVWAFAYAGALVSFSERNRDARPEDVLVSSQERSGPAEPIVKGMDRAQTVAKTTAAPST